MVVSMSFRVVIKYRAPNGALRPVIAAAHGCGEVEVIKHRASNDALRRADLGILPPAFTEGVIKHRATGGALRHARPRGVGCSVVHGHKDRAPNGALRLERVVEERVQVELVIKHRAPNGTLRPSSALL